VRLLAGLSKFVIADITNPKSAPLELQAAVPEIMVPFRRIIEEPIYSDAPSPPVLFFCRKLKRAGGTPRTRRLIVARTTAWVHNWGGEFA
jgi:hypothetical protein